MATPFWRLSPAAAIPMDRQTHVKTKQALEKTSACRE
jgi:hypothetical protein